MSFPLEREFPAIAGINISTIVEMTISKTL